MLKLELSSDEALVLFEWLSNHFENMAKDINVWSDPNEIVLSSLLGQLEKDLAEPFAANYGDLVLAAGLRLLEKHS